MGSATLPPTRILARDRCRRLAEMSFAPLRRPAAALLFRRSPPTTTIRPLSLWATTATASRCAARRCPAPVGVARRCLADKAEIDLTIETLAMDEEM